MAQEIVGSNPTAHPISSPIAGRTRGTPELAPLGWVPKVKYAPVAQRIEHWASDPGVAGSSPAGRASLLTRIGDLANTRIP